MKYMPLSEKQADRWAIRCPVNLIDSPRST
jgi:hypothetical protein